MHAATDNKDNILLTTMIIQQTEIARNGMAATDNKENTKKWNTTPNMAITDKETEFDKVK